MVANLQWRGVRGMSVRNSFSGDEITLRDRLASVYFTVYTPFTNRLILYVTVVLVLISLFRARYTTHGWYHMMETVLATFFVSEIALRLFLTRSNMFESLFNVVEGVTCVLCLCILSFLQVQRFALTIVEEHTVIFARYIAQLLRVAGIIAINSVQSKDECADDEIRVYEAGSDLLTSADLTLTRMEDDVLDGLELV